MAENRFRWQLGLNDPTFGGWVTTGGYFIAAWLTMLAARSASPGGHERGFWWLACALLLALGLNKQLDLHILLTDIGRGWAIDSGLYQQRRALQRGFMLAVALAGLVVALAGLLSLRRADRAVRLAAAGLAFTACYVLVRAAAFNHTGSLLRAEIGRMRLDWLIELAGIALTALGAWRYRTSRHG